MLLLILSCTSQTEADCRDACDLLYQSCYDEDDATTHAEACYAECGMVQDDSRVGWSECVSTRGLLDGAADACLLTGAECHYSPCANDAEWRWGLAFPENADWSCE